MKTRLLKNSAYVPFQQGYDNTGSVAPGNARVFGLTLHDEQPSPGGGPGMAPQSLGLAAPSKKYPKIGQVTPGQGGLAVDPLNIQPLGLSSVTSPEPDLRRGPFPDGPIPRQPPISPLAPPVAGPLAQPPSVAPQPMAAGGGGKGFGFIPQPAAPSPSFAPQATIPSPLGPVTPVRPEFKGYSPEEFDQRAQMARSGQLGGRSIFNPQAGQQEFYPSDPYNPPPMKTPNSHRNDAYYKDVPGAPPPAGRPSPLAPTAPPQPSLGGPLAPAGGQVPPSMEAAGALGRQLAASQYSRGGFNATPMPPEIGGAPQAQASSLYNMAHPGYQSLNTPRPSLAPGGNPALADQNLIAKNGFPGEFAPTDDTKVAGARLDLAQSRRANGFTPSPGGMSPQEKYDMRQFDKREGARKLAADRQAGRVQTPRQMRDAAKAAEQQTAFERGLGPQAYVGLQQAKTSGALASEQMKSREKLSRDQMAQQKEVALAQIAGANQRANTAVLGKGIDPKTGLAVTPPKPPPDPPEQPTALAQLGGRLSEGLAAAAGFTGTSNLPPVAHATRAGRPRLGPPGQLNGLRTPIGPEHLIPQPGDNPTQAAARASLRKKHSGLRTQLEISGRLKPGE